MDLEDSGTLTEETLGGSDVESMLVVCVASRRALMVELALKQFSTRRETPAHVSEANNAGT